MLLSCHPCAWFLSQQANVSGRSELWESYRTVTSLPTQPWKTCLFCAKISFPLKKIAETPLSHIFDWCLTIHFMLHWHISLSHTSNTKLMNNGQTEEMWTQLFTIYMVWCFQQCWVLLFFSPKEWQTSKQVYANHQIPSIPLLIRGY